MPPTSPPQATAPLTSDAALEAARDRALWCDLTPLALLSITGPDATPFLNGQLSVDVRHLGPGAVRHASFNSPKGRMLANLLLWRAETDPVGYRALLAGDIAEPVRKRLAMYVLRSKVTLADVSGQHVRLGVGGPLAADALRAEFGAAPEPLTVHAAGSATFIGLPASRFLIVAPLEQSAALRAALGQRIAEGDYAAWQWLTVRAGIPVVTAATQDAFVAQTGNWDVLGGIDFQKGCYTGQEIIARTQYLGRLKERTFLFHTSAVGVVAGTRLFSPVFGDQPCGTVVNAANAPGGGSDLLAVLQLSAAERDDTRLSDPSGPTLQQLPLPYAIPEPTAPRGRLT
jgi:hypothetical protein